VAVLDDVVLGLGPARVPGEAAALLEPAEVLPAGEELVHVRLVAGVEDDPVAGRVEHPVDGERELDHAQVGAQVAPGPRHLLDQEPADLPGQVVEFGTGQGAEVRRSTDVREIHHRRISSSVTDAAAAPILGVHAAASGGEGVK
jgi:hypothetical protein